MKLKNGVPSKLVFFPCCCCFSHYHYYSVTHDALGFKRRMLNTKMSKRSCCFFKPSFHSPIGQIYSLESNLPFHSQFPVDDFPISICTMMFAWKWDTHTHTLGPANHFPATKTSVALDTCSNSSSFVGISWTIFRPFEMELNTIAYVICSLHLDLDFPPLSPHPTISQSIFFYHLTHVHSLSDPVLNFSFSHIMIFGAQCVKPTFSKRSFSHKNGNKTYDVKTMCTCNFCMCIAITYVVLRCA